MSDDRMTLVGAGLIGLAAMIAAFAYSVEPQHSDPRQGWTSTEPVRICDGTTLVYKVGGAVLDSPECQP